MKKNLLLILGCLIITYSYSSNEMPLVVDLNDNQYVLETTEADIDGFKGENMDYLNGEEDYTYHEGVDYTDKYHTIDDLQEKNRNNKISDILSPFISFLMPLGFYLLYKLLKKMIIIANESE